MAYKENIKKYPDIFIDEETGEPFNLNSRRWNENGNPLCTGDNNTCTNSAHNKGKNHGGFSLLCKDHLGHLGKSSYKNHKTKVPYCENIDGRLGYKCTTTIANPCMLGVDHIDEDHHNDDDANLQTLCACCHSYKTKIFGSKIKAARKKSISHGKLEIVAQQVQYNANRKKFKKETT